MPEPDAIRLPIGVGALRVIYLGSLGTCRLVN
jgi:hypothetical protein